MDDSRQSRNRIGNIAGWQEKIIRLFGWGGGANIVVLYSLGND